METLYMKDDIIASFSKWVRQRWCIVVHMSASVPLHFGASRAVLILLEPVSRPPMAALQTFVADLMRAEEDSASML